jgi:hypothetical protein
VADIDQKGGPEEFGDEGKRWEAELESAQKPEQKFRDIAKRIEERYRDEEDAQKKDARARRFNILWSNTEILNSALTARDPKPIIERRYRDDDPIARTSSQVLDRCAAYHIDQSWFRTAWTSAVKDATLIGRGVARVRYAPEYGPEQPGPDGQPFKPVTYEEAKLEHVWWGDFLTSPARCWEQVRWVAFRALMTRDQMREHPLLGKEADKVNLSWYPDDKIGPGEREDTYQVFKRAEVFEIWNRANKQVYFYCKGHPRKILAAVPDPLGLKDFFPCPKPLAFTTTTSDIIPRAEYELYRDQAEEIDSLTSRINRIIKAIRVAGVYNAANAELQDLLSAVENGMLPVKNWQAFADKGGFKGAVDWLPIEPMANTLVQLAEARERIKQELYEVTGIGDIIRGASDPDETATAQRIKGRFAGLRLEDKKTKVEAFCRDALELMAEVIAEHFQPETFKLMTGLKLPDTPEQAMMMAMAQQQQGPPLAA